MVDGNDIEQRQQDIRRRQQQLDRRQQRIQDPDIRRTDQSRSIADLQNRQRRIDRQQQRLDQQDRRLEEAKTKTVGGIELPRDKDVETFAAQVEGTLQDGDTLAEALAMKGAVNIERGQELTAEQRETAQKLIEFEDEREQRIEEEREREVLREALEGQNRGDIVRRVDAGNIQAEITKVEVDGKRIPITQQTAETLEDTALEDDVVRIAVAEPAVTIPFQEPPDPPDDVGDVDPFRRDVKETPLPENGVDQLSPVQQIGSGLISAGGAAFEGAEQFVNRLVPRQELEQRGGRGRTAIIQPSQPVIGTDERTERTVEAPDLGNITAFRDPTRGEIRETGRQALLAGSQVGQGVSRLLPFSDIGKALGDDRLLFERRNIPATQDLEDFEGGGIPGAELTGETLDLAAGEIGDAVITTSGTPAIAADVTRGVQEFGLTGLERTAQTARSGTIKIVNELRDNPQQLSAEVLSEGIGLLFGSPVVPTIRSPGVGTQIGRAGDTVSDALVRETVQDIEEVPPTTRDPARNIERIPGGFRLSDDVQDATVPFTTTEGGLERTIQVPVRQTPRQIRRQRTRELPLVPDRLKRTDVEEDVFFEDEGAGPLVRERRRIERLPDRDEIFEFLKPQRRKGELAPQRQLQDAGDVREQFFGQDFRRTPEPETRIQAQPQQLVAPVFLQQQNRSGVETGFGERQQPGVRREPQREIPQQRSFDRQEPEVGLRDVFFSEQRQDQQRIEQVRPQVGPVDPFRPQANEPTAPFFNLESDAATQDQRSRDSGGQQDQSFAPSLLGLSLGFEEDASADQLAEQTFSGIGIRGLPDFLEGNNG